MGKMNDVERIKRSRKKDNLPTKVVIRRLPQGLTKDEFLAEVGPLPEHDHMSFHSADHSYETAYFSRAYINFINFSDIYAFKNKFDHHHFVSSSGVESLAVVELALFQGVPRLQIKKRKDPRCGTIEKDSDYLTFLESLEKDKEPPQSAEVYLEQLEARKAELKASKEVTPLIEFIRSRRAARAAHKHTNNEKRSRKDQEPEKESRSQRKKQDEIRKSTSKKPLSNKPHSSESKTSKETKRHADSSSSKPLPRRGGERNHTADKDKDHQASRSKSSSKQYNNSRPASRPTSSKGPRNEKGKYNQDNRPSSTSSSGTVHSKKSTNSVTVGTTNDQLKTEDTKKTKEHNENISPRDKATKRKNKDRPEMAIYRPPSRPSSGKGRDAKSSSKEKPHAKDEDK